MVWSHQDDVCGLNKELAQVLAAALRDASKDGLTAGGVLAWHQSDPGAKITTSIECFAFADRGDHGGGDHWSDAWNAHQAPAIPFRFADLLNLIRDLVDAPIKPEPFVIEVVRRNPGYGPGSLLPWCIKNNFVVLTARAIGYEMLWWDGFPKCESRPSIGLKEAKSSANARWRSVNTLQLR